MKEGDLQHKQIIKSISLKTDTEIVDKAIASIEVNLPDSLELILQTKKLTDKFPSMEDKIEEKIKRIILHIKEKSLIGPFVGMLEQKVNSSDSGTD